MSKRNKKRSVLKKRKRRMNYNGIKVGDFIKYLDMQYKVIALMKHGYVTLDDGNKVETKKCQKISN